MNNGDSCKTCAFNVMRTDMKNIKYCIKRNFPILNDGEGCSKYVSKKSSK